MQKQNLKLKLFFLNVLTFLFLSKVTAQTSTNAAGGDASGAGGSVAYSVGRWLVFTKCRRIRAIVLQPLQRPKRLASRSEHPTFKYS